MGDRPLRVGLIGAGRRGTAHAATLACLRDWYELVAICDPVEASARAVAARMESATVHTDLNECLARERPDAVVIATPPETHHLAAKAAADHRAHMLIETPLAPTRAMMDFIAEAADKAGVQVEVGENYGRRPAERLNREALQAGLIGNLLHLSAFNAPANHESCYHTMSLFLAYAGQDVVEVHAIGRRRSLDLATTGAAGPDAETWVDAVLTFADGVAASCSFVTTWTTALRWGRPRIATIEGTAGYIVAADGENRLHRLEHGVARDYSLRVETRRLEHGTIPIRYYYDTTPPVRVVNPFADRLMADAEPVGVADGLARADELLSLYRAVTDGAAPEFGLARARRSQELGIAIAESSRLGCSLEAKLGGETTWERDQHEMLQRRWGAHPLKDVGLLAKHGGRLVS